MPAGVAVTGVVLSLAATAVAPTTAENAEWIAEMALEASSLEATEERINRISGQIEKGRYVDSDGFTDALRVGDEQFVVTVVACYPGIDEDERRQGTDQLGQRTTDAATLDRHRHEVGHQHVAHLAWGFSRA